MIFPSLLAFSLLTTGIQCLAQEGFPQWVGDLYQVGIWPEGYPKPGGAWVLIDEKDDIQLTIPNLDSLSDFPVPWERRNTTWNTLYWLGDVGYTMTRGKEEEVDEDGSKFIRYIFAKWQEGEWHYLGEYKNTDHSFQALPCHNNRFIVISPVNDLMGNLGLKRTPFARLSLVDGKTEFKLDSSIDHGQDALRPYMGDLAVFKQAYTHLASITDGYATLVNPINGLYWVFSLEKATLRHAGNIFKKVTPEMIAKDGTYELILSMHPEKSGTVLIAAQEEDFFLREDIDSFRELQELFFETQGTERQELYKILKRRYYEMIDNSPFIAWYRLYPESGKVEKLSEPPEGGSWYRERGRNDSWRPMPDGSVKMGWRNQNVTNRLKGKTANSEPKAEQAPDTGEEGADSGGEQ
jgi:hypothetical protein